MRNRQIGLALFFSFALALTGCNKEDNVQNKDQMAVVEAEEIDETGFGITLEEQKICAEYAAGVLMKYNAGTNMRVLEGKNLEIKEAEEQVKKAQEERRAQLASEYQENKKEESADSSSAKGDKAGSLAATVNYINDMSVAIGTEAFSIHYDGYEITDSYAGEEDSFFAVDAVQGKVLLVAKFAVTNISSQTENFNMYATQSKCRLKINQDSYKAQQTLLLNDLSMYKGDIEAGETVEAVLVFEIPQDKSVEGNMELMITVGEETSTMLLQGGSAVINVSEETVEEEVSDLAAEYEAALQAEEASEESDYEEINSEESSGGNVTVVGSNNSISQE